MTLFLTAVFSLLVGIGIGYAFRGKESRAIAQAGETVKSEVSKL